MARAMNLLFGRNGVERNCREATQLVQECADHKHPRALSLLGNWSKWGFASIKVDKQRAEELLSEALLLDDPLAAFWCYSDGVSVEPDNEMAFAALQKGDSSDPILISLLGYCYAKGVGVPQDLVRAFQLYETSATLGYPLAFFALSHTYFSGHGTVVDLQLGWRWLLQSAECENGLAMVKYAVCRLQGLYGKTPHPEEAYKWFHKAAVDLHQPLSMYNVGLCYAQGRGVTQDLSQALYWLRRSGHEMAGEAAARVEARMRVLEAKKSAICDS